MFQRSWQQGSILAGITLLVFSPTLSSEFVYDARLQILTDPFLHDPKDSPVNGTSATVFRLTDCP